ncbi:MULTISPECIES: hypothetical protein [unclassified Anaerobiospirillum]|uniref:hypothetical protein n=1 Tax=unclassified Anaerobiospirillum TaxID=2647410 RepID=UPI001FF3F51E|nr:MULTISPECIES: hypothetical protein [unclassified Anaerobiospirillum]MCK0535089.1 hypothetical protein [Anaerobiospirillum sp. NML120511]MCK0540262.1 hypothetical protein [Anaerobiospirillum sp. NML02-A-032]
MTSTKSDRKAHQADQVQSSSLMPENSELDILSPQDAREPEAELSTQARTKGASGSARSAKAATATKAAKTEKGTRSTRTRKAASGKKAPGAGAADHSADLDHSAAASGQQAAVSGASAAHKSAAASQKAAGAVNGDHYSDAAYDLSGGRVAGDDGAEGDADSAGADASAEKSGERKARPKSRATSKSSAKGAATSQETAGAQEGDHYSEAASCLNGGRVAGEGSAEGDADSAGADVFAEGSGEIKARSKGRAAAKGNAKGAAASQEADGAVEGDHYREAASYLSGGRVAGEGCDGAGADSAGADASAEKSGERKARSKARAGSKGNAKGAATSQEVTGAVKRDHYSEAASYLSEGRMAGDDGAEGGADSAGAEASAEGASQRKARSKGRAAAKANAKGAAASQEDTGAVEGDHYREAGYDLSGGRVAGDDGAEGDCDSADAGVSAEVSGERKARSRGRAAAKAQGSSLKSGKAADAGRDYDCALDDLSCESEKDSPAKAQSARTGTRTAKSTPAGKKTSPGSCAKADPSDRPGFADSPAGADHSEAAYNQDDDYTDGSNASGGDSCACDGEHESGSDSSSQDRSRAMGKGGDGGPAAAAASVAGRAQGRSGRSGAASEGAGWHDSSSDIDGAGAESNLAAATMADLQERSAGEISRQGVLAGGPGDAQLVAASAGEREQLLDITQFRNRVLFNLGRELRSAAPAHNRDVLMRGSMTVQKPLADRRLTLLSLPPEQLEVVTSSQPLLVVDALTGIDLKALAVERAVWLYTTLTMERLQDAGAAVAGADVVGSTVDSTVHGAGGDAGSEAVGDHDGSERASESSAAGAGAGAAGAGPEGLTGAGAAAGRARPVKVLIVSGRANGSRDFEELLCEHVANLDLAHFTVCDQVNITGSLSQWDVVVISDATAVSPWLLHRFTVTERPEYLTVFMDGAEFIHNITSHGDEPVEHILALGMQPVLSDLEIAVLGYAMARADIRGPDADSLIDDALYYAEHFCSQEQSDLLVADLYSSLKGEYSKSVRLSPAQTRKLNNMLRSRLNVDPDHPGRCELSKVSLNDDERTALMNWQLRPQTFLEQCTSGQSATVFTSALSHSAASLARAWPWQARRNATRRNLQLFNDLLRSCGLEGFEAGVSARAGNGHHNCEHGLHSAALPGLAQPGAAVPGVPLPGAALQGAAVPGAPLSAAAVPGTVLPGYAGTAGLSGNAGGAGLAGSVGIDAHAANGDSAPDASDGLSDAQAACGAAVTAQGAAYGDYHGAMPGAAQGATAGAAHTAAQGGADGFAMGTAAGSAEGTVDGTAVPGAALPLWYEGSLFDELGITLEYCSKVLHSPDVLPSVVYLDEKARRPAVAHALKAVPGDEGLAGDTVYDGEYGKSAAPGQSDASGVTAENAASARGRGAGDSAEPGDSLDAGMASGGSYGDSEDGEDGQSGPEEHAGHAGKDGASGQSDYDDGNAAAGADSASGLYGADGLDCLGGLDIPGGLDGMGGFNGFDVRENLDAVEQIGFGPRQACGASGPEQGLGLAPEVLCALTAELEIPVFHSFAFALASMQVYLNARMGFKVDATAQKGWSAFVRRKKWRSFADDFDRRWLQCVTTLRANRQERCEAQTALRLLTLNTTAAPLLTSALHNFASRWYRDHGIDTRLALNSDESHWQLMDAAARASLLSQADALDEAWARSLADHGADRSTGTSSGAGTGAGARAAHSAGAGAGPQALAGSAGGAGAGSIAVSPAGAALRAQALSFKALSAFDRNRLALLASLGDWCLDHMDSTAAGSTRQSSSLSSGAGAQSMGLAASAAQGGTERHAQERQRQLMVWMLSKGLTPSQSATMLRMEQLHEALLALQSASACSCTLPGISSQGRGPWGNSSFIDGAPGSFYRRYGRGRSANVTLGMSPAAPAAAAANAAAAASASGDGAASASSAMEKSSTLAAGAAVGAASAAAAPEADASLLAVSPASAQSAAPAGAAAAAADTGGLRRGGAGAGGSGMRAKADSMWAQWERMLKARLRNVWHRPHYVLLEPSVLSRPQAEDHAWGSLKLISHAPGLKEEARREAACSVVLDESNELLSCSLSFKQQWYEDAALDAAVSGLATLAQRAAISGSPVQPLAVTPRRGRSRIDGNSHSTLIRALQQLPQRTSSATRAAASTSSSTASAINAGYGQGAPLSAAGAAQSAAAGYSSPLGVNDQAGMTCHTGMNGKAGQAAHNDHAGQHDYAAQPGSAAKAGQALSGPVPGGGPAAPALWQQGVSFEGINSAVPLWSTLQGSLLPGAACWQPDLTTAWTISSVQTSFNVPGLRPLAATLSSQSYDALADEVRAGLNIRTEAQGRTGCAAGRGRINTRFCPDLNGGQVSMNSLSAAADGFSSGAAAWAMTGHAPAPVSGAGACGAVDCGTAVPGAGSAAGAAAAAGAVAGHCSFSAALPDRQWSRLSLTSSMGAWTVAMALHCGSDVMSSLQRRSRDSLQVQELRDRVYYQSQFDNDEGSAAVSAHAHADTLAHGNALAHGESAGCGVDLAHGVSAGCGDDLAHEEVRAHAAHADLQSQESAQVKDHGQSQTMASARRGAVGAAGGRGAAAVAQRRTVAKRRTVARSIKGAPEEIDTVSVRQPALLAVFTSRRLNDERREHQYSPWRTFYNEDESAWLSDLMAAVCYNSRDEQALLSTVLLCSDNREISTVLDAVNTAAARMHYQGSDDLGLPYHDHSHIPASRRALQAAAALHGTDGTAAAAGAPAPLDERGARRSGQTGEVLAAGSAVAAGYAADGGTYGSAHDGYSLSGHNGQPGHNGSYSNHSKSAKSSHNGPYSQSRNSVHAGLYGSRTQADLSHEWTTFWSWGSDLSAAGIEASLSAALFAPGSQSEQAVLAAKADRYAQSLTGSSADELSGAGTGSVSAGALAGGTVPATSVLAEVAAEAARQAHYDLSGLSDLYGDSDVQDRPGNLDNPDNSQSDSLSASIADGTAILLACGKGSGLRPGINPFPSGDRHKSAGRRAAEAANMGTERSDSLIKQAVHNSRDHMLDSLAGLIDPQRPHGPAEAGRLEAVPGTQGLSEAQGANGAHSLSSVPGAPAAQGTSAAQEAAAVAAAASGAQGAPLSSGKPGIAGAAGSPCADTSSELARAGILTSGPAAAYAPAAVSEHGALTSGWVSLQLQRAAARNTYYLFAQTGGEGIIERSLLPPEILEQLAQQAEDSESVSGQGQGQMQGLNQSQAHVQTAVTGRNVAPIGSCPWQPGNGLQPLTALSTEQLWPVIVPAAPGDIRSALDNSAEYQAASDSAFAVSRAVFASSGIEQTTLKSPDKAMVEAACNAFAQADMAGCTLKRSRFYAGTDEAIAHAFALPSRARSRREQQLQRQRQSQEQLQGNEQPQGDFQADRNQDLYSSGGLYVVSAGAHDEHHDTAAGAAAAAGTGYDSGQDRGHEGMPGYRQSLLSGTNLTDSIEGDDYLDNDSAADAMTTLYAGLGPDPDLRYGGDERSRALEQAAADLRVRVGQAQQRCREAAAAVKTLADRVMGRFSSVELSQIEDTGDALPEFVLQIEDFVPDLYSRYAVFNTAADDFSWLGLPAGEPGAAQTSMVATRQHGTAQYLDFMLRYGSTPVRTSLSAHSMELVMSRALNAQLRSSSHQTTVLRHIFELYRLTLAHLETSSTPAALRSHYATGLKNVERAAVDFLVELITSLMRPQPLPKPQPQPQPQGQAQPDAHTSARAGAMAIASAPQARPDLMGRAHVYEQGHAIGVSGVAQCDAVQGQALHRINNVVSAPAAAILREAESSLSSRVYFGDDSNAAARCAAGITINPEVRSGSQDQQCHSSHEHGWFSAEQQDQAAAQRMLREELMLESHYEQFNEYTLVAFEFMDKLRKELDLDSFDWGINLTTAGEDYVYVRERNELSRRRACGEEPSGALDWQLLHSLLPEQKQRWFITRVLEVSSWLDNSHARRNSGYFEYAGVLSLKDRITMAALSPDFMTGAVTLLSSLMAINSPLAHSRTARRFDAIMAHSFRLPQEGRLPALTSARADEQAPAAPAAVSTAAAASFASGEETACLSQHQLERIRNFFVSRAITMAEQNDDSRRSIELQLLAPSAHDRVICLLCAQHLSALHPLYENMRDEMIQAWLPAPGSDLNALADKVRKDRELAREQIAARAPQGSVSSRPSELAEVLEVNDGYDAAYGQMLEAVSTALQDDYEVFSSELTRAAAARTRFKISAEEININFFSRLNQEHVDRICIMLGPDEVPKMKELVPVAGLARSEVRVVHCHEKLTTGLSQVTGTALTMHQELIRRLS